jgi:RND family efflux transporter MFP subunit
MKASPLRLLFALCVGLLGTATAHATDGTVQWAQRVELSIPVSGVVQTVAGRPGDRVKKGQVLIELEQTPFTTELDQARAAHVDADTKLRVADRDLHQAQELYARALNSTDELEDAKLQKKRADAAVEAARARVRRAKYELDRSIARAPFDGWILRRQVEPGQSIISTQQASVLMVVAAADRYVARVQVSGDTVAHLNVGDSAQVKVDGRSYDGKIRSIGLEPETDTAVARYPVAVEFNSAGARLYAGQKASVSF